MSTAVKAVSLDWVLNQLAGMKFPEQGGAYDFIKRSFENAQTQPPPSEGLTFHIFARGDRTVGDGDHYATVEIPYAAVDFDYQEFVRDELRATFADIFDNKDVRVQTQKEREAEEAAEVARDAAIDDESPPVIVAHGYTSADGRRWTP